MESRRTRQLVLQWREEERRLPEVVEERLRGLVAQLLRIVVAAERDTEETGDE